MADRGSIGGLGQVDGTGGSATHSTGFAPSPAAVTNGGGTAANTPGLPTIRVTATGLAGSVVVTGGGSASSVVVIGG